jgi:hypothetical protein
MRSATSRTIASVRPADCTHSVRLGSGFAAVIVDVSNLVAVSATGAEDLEVGAALEV